ncbi:MAG: NAD-glutamate dehydrogenase [Alphaproteobacteria bacterium]
MIAASLIKNALASLPKKTSASEKQFIEEFYKQIPSEDVTALPAEEIARIGHIHYEAGLKRGRKDHIEISHIEKEQDERVVKRTTIDIITDDRPFTLDSIAAELSAQGLIINLSAHASFHVSNNKEKAEYIYKDDQGSVVQGHLHIELNSYVAQTHIAPLKAALKTILRDVKYATEDWQKMRVRLRAAQKSLSQAPTDYPEHEIEEYLNFLEYLYQDNFTFLGYREYKFTGKGKEIKSETVKNENWGVLREKAPVYINEDEDGLPPALQMLRKAQPPVNVSKVNKKSTVHRRVPLDAIAIKLFNEKGEVTGEALFIGLFTSVTYSRSIQSIPYLRLKADAVIAKAGYKHGGHNDKALRHILEKYPRDELFQIDIPSLTKICKSILRLQERERIALYTRPDPFGRYISCLVYIPRSRYSTRMRLKFQRILEAELGGECTNYKSQIDDSSLCRVLYTIHHKKRNAPKFDNCEIERKLQEVGKLWRERLTQTLLDNTIYEESYVVELIARYGEAFPMPYRDQYSLMESIADIAKLEEARKSEDIAVDLYWQPEEDKTPAGWGVKIYSHDKPIALSDMLPIVENAGLRIISEHPVRVRPKDGSKKTYWIHDLTMEPTDPELLKETAVYTAKAKTEEALHKLWSGEMENDTLNKLLVSANMDWRDVSILRCYVRYLKQARFPYSQEYIESAITANPKIAAHLIDLFHAWHAPANKKDANMKAAGAALAIDHALEKVDSYDHDSILRALYTLVDATLRTNFYISTKELAYKPTISIKIDSRKVPFLPEPRPYREIFVYSPRFEGIHLRGDVIARGGLRWSDRNEDFRTEILGLMKAQLVKNAVIVPMGAKGGFVLKKPPKEGGRQAFMDEGVACYKLFIRSLLDITDNRIGKRVVAPKMVMRRDGEDPYLVVAADKGTATFSDIANEISLEYDHWLGDAFASGGSAGYDHKKMGITARGAWESVKRSFRETGRDIQSQDFTVVGVGDMGGDVFGNGMLLSEHIRLQGAFNHLHIFCDPEPDIAKSYKERKRLFDNVMGWDQYDTKLLSKGGRIYSRHDKLLELTPQIKKAFDIEANKVTPHELMKAMLKADVDLLWFGGIGTYIKSEDESHADASDKANDLIRINGKDVRAKAVGEGANLGVTQRGRIEYAKRGGRINADFIDNSGGVDSSDHEVNIKILLNEVMREENTKLPLKKRNTLLAKMTDDVAKLVLKHNYQQAQAISLAEFKAKEHLQAHAALIDEFESSGVFERELEYLPDAEEIDRRRRAGEGLTRPEIGVLSSYAKIVFTKKLLDSDFLDAPELSYWAVDYFPKAMQKQYRDEILNHRLRREIIATRIANSVINRMGPDFVRSRVIKTGMPPSEVAKAYLIVREAFDLQSLWTRIEALDNVVPAKTQIKAMNAVVELVERETTWLLTKLGKPLDISTDIHSFKTGVNALKKTFETTLTEDEKLRITSRYDALIADGLPEDIAKDIAGLPALGSACDIIRVAIDSTSDIEDAARIFYQIGEVFHLEWLREQAKNLPVNNKWNAEALDGLIDQLYSCQTGLAVHILRSMKPKERKDKHHSFVRTWIDRHEGQAAAVEHVFSEIRAAAKVDMGMLIIVEQRLRALYGG